MKAYFEWMPIRLTHKNHIYRSFNVGTLLNLMTLDTRHTDRDKQIEFSKYFSKEGFKFDNFYSDLNHTARKLIGNNQLEWLESKLKMNSAKWNVVAQQVLMTKIKEDMKDIGKVELHPKFDGKQMIMVIQPI